MDRYELIVIGGGPAGISCATYSKRYGVDVCLFAEKIGGQVNYTDHIFSNPSAGHGVESQKLIARYLNALKYENVPIVSTRVKLVEKYGNDIVVHHSHGVSIAGSLVVAVGRGPVKLALPIKGKISGGRVFYFTDFPYGKFVDSKKALIIGGGYSGIDMIESLGQRFSEYVVVEKSDKLGSNEHRRKRLLSRNDISIFMNSEVKEVEESNRDLLVRILTPKGEDEHAVDAIFVAVGSVPDTSFIDCVDRNELGEIIVKKSMAEGTMYETSEENIFACGDCTDIIPKGFEIVAAGQGVQCAKVVAGKLGY
ncbi:MAG: NAD(P)/FAD-dependent oxidoreductase [Methanobacteriota archaeon]|nr:MAG: NAD(P)/FAD-dependent oxidoreductase [Euryarchaeota archaeon]